MFAIKKFEAFGLQPSISELKRKRSEGRLKSNASTTDVRIFSTDKEEQRKAYYDVGAKPGTHLGNYIPIHTLIKCVNNLKGGEIDDSANKLSELQQKNEALLKEVEMLKSIISDKENEIQHLLEGFAASASGDGGEFLKVIADLKSQIAQLKDELAEKDKLPEGMKVDFLEAEIDDRGAIGQNELNDIIEQLQKKLKEEEEKANDCANQLKNIRDANDMGDDDKMKRIFELEDELAKQRTLTRNDAELENQLNEAKEKVDSLNKDLKEALNQLEVERSKNKAYEEKLIEAEKMIDELQKLMNMPGASDVDVPTKVFAEASNIEQTMLEEEIDRLKELLKDAEKKNEELLAQIKSAQEVSLLGDDEKVKMIADLQMQLNEQNKLMEGLLANVNDLEKQLKEEKEKGEICAEQLKVALKGSGEDDKLKQMNELLSQLAEQKRLMDDMQSELSEERKKRENCDKQLKTALESGTLGDDEKLKRIQELQSQIENQRIQIEKLQDQLNGEKQKTDNCAQQLKTALESTGLSDDDKIKKINELQAQISEQNKQMQNLKQQLQNLKRKGDENTENVKLALEPSVVGDDDKAKVISELKAKINDLLNQLNDEKENGKACAQQLKAALEASSLGDDEVLKKINELVKQLEEKKKQMEYLQIDLDEEKSKREDVDRKLKTALDSATVDDDEKTRKIKELQSQIESQKKNMENLQQQINKEKQNMENYADQLKTTRKSTVLNNDDKAKNVNDLESKISDQNDEIDDLRQQLQDLKRKGRESVAKVNMALEPSAVDNKDHAKKINELETKLKELMSQLNEEKKLREKCAQELKTALEGSNLGSDESLKKINDLMNDLAEQKKLMENIKSKLDEEVKKGEICAEQLKTALKSSELSGDDKLEKINELQAKLTEKMNTIQDLEKQLREEKEKLKSEIEGNKKTIQDLQQQLQKEKLNGEACAAQLKTALESTGLSDDGKAQKINELQAELANKIKLIQDLENKLQEENKVQRRSPDDQSKLIQDLQQQLNEEKQKGNACAEQLKTALASTAASDDDKVKLINDLQKRLSDKEKAIQDLEKMIKEEKTKGQMKSPPGEDQKSAIEALQRQLNEEKQKANACAEQLKTALESSGLSDDDKVKKINELQGQLSEKNKLIQNLQNLQSQVEDQKKIIQDLQNKLSDEKLKSKSLAEQLKTALESTGLSDDGKMKKINDLQAQLAAKNKLIQDLEKKKTSQVDDSNLRDLKKQLEDKNKKIKDLEKRLSDEKFKGDQCVEQLKVAMQSNTMSFDDKLKMINDLQSQLSEQKKLVKDLQDQLNEEKEAQDNCKKQLKEALGSKRLKSFDDSETKVAELKLEPQEQFDIKQEKRVDEETRVKSIIGDVQDDTFLPTDKPWEEVYFEKPIDAATKRINQILKLARQFGIEALFLDDLRLLHGAISDALSLQEDPMIKDLAQKKNIKDSREIVKAIYCSPLMREELREIHQAVTIVFETLKSRAC